MADALSQWQLRTDINVRSGIIIIMIHRVRRRLQNFLLLEKNASWPSPLTDICIIHTYNGKRMLPKIPREGRRIDHNCCQTQQNLWPWAAGHTQQTCMQIGVLRIFYSQPNPGQPSPSSLLGWLGKEVGWPGAAAEAGSTYHSYQERQEDSSFFFFSPFPTPRPFQFPL